MNLINIWFSLPDGRNYNFTGMVTTRRVSPSKLFLKVFGFELPAHTEITLA